MVGKFVEFYGPGVSQLSIADRATISNMCPEYGATVGFFAVDDMSMKYLKQTGENYDVSFVNVCATYKRALFFKSGVHLMVVVCVCVSAGVCVSTSVNIIDMHIMKWVISITPYSPLSGYGVH